MKPACVAIVGKSNNPIFVQTFEGGSSTDDELKYHFIVHTSLDVVEEKVAAKEKQGSLDSYLGLLYPTEGLVLLCVGVYSVCIFVCS